MLDVEFFTDRKILLAQRNFLSPAECKGVIADIDSSISIEAKVYDGQSKSQPQTRKTRVHRVPDRTFALIEKRVKAFYPNIRDFFGFEPIGHESPQFLRYEVGYFFKPHRDREKTVPPEGYAPRRATFVLFLNSQAPAKAEIPPGGYRGGSLVIYGDMARGQGRLGMPLRGDQGLLIAFNPNFIHEVVPVEEGTRYTVTGWFN